MNKTELERINEFIKQAYGDGDSHWYVYRNPRNGQILVKQGKGCKCLALLGTYETREQALAHAENVKKSMK